MSIVRFPRVGEYLVSLLATAAAYLVVLVLGRVGYTGNSPLLGAVVISAWYGGLGPGVVSLVLSSVIAYRLFPRHDGATDQIDLLRTAVFSLVAVVASALHFVTRRARKMAEKSRDAAEHAQIAAEESNAAKTRFLAMVSHELRTPLSPVLMAVAAAESDPVVVGRVRRELETIRRNVALQVRLIDDLLDIAKVAHGKLPLNLVKLSVHDPLAAAISSCSGELQERKLPLRQDLAASKQYVYGDSDRLQQVFWNLLQNAIKFTPEGGWIAVRTFNESDWVIVEVVDNGHGIAKHRIGTIFTAFEQGDEEVTRRFGGLGLGLSICSALVNAHDGTISAQSDGPGKGAIFTVRLPVS